MPTVDVPGAELYYRVDDFTDAWKPAETVFLHHPAAGNVERWRPWIPYLSRRYRVVRMDARGHGRSSTPPPGYQWSIERLARDVYDVLTEIGTGPVHYVGNSAGGIIGQQFTHDFPHMVKSLTLIGSTPRMKQTNVDYGEWLDRINRLGVRGFFHSDAPARFSPDADPRLIDWFADETGKTPESVVTTFVPYMASVDLTDLLPSIKVPVLLLNAAEDDITPPAILDVFKEFWPEARIKILPVKGHNIGDGYPDECARAVREFLDDVSEANGD